MSDAQFWLNWATQAAIAVGTVGAVVVALFGGRLRERARVQGCLSALYVEAYHRAARIAVDTQTFLNEVQRINSQPARDRPQANRTARNIKKFLPVPADVYRQLAGGLGRLPATTQVPLAMLHFRLEMVARDIARLSESVEGPIGDDATVQIAKRLWDCCQPALDALDALAGAIRNSDTLTKKLDESMRSANYPLNGTVREMLKELIAGQGPHVCGLPDFRA